MRFFDLPKADLLILKDLNGEYLAKCALFFYFVDFGRTVSRETGTADRQSWTVIQEPRTAAARNQEPDLSTLKPVCARRGK